MKTLRVAAAALCLLTHAAAQQFDSKILEQKNSPVVIETYEAKFQRRIGTYQREGISHSMTYRNNTDRRIVAVQFGLVSFDIWNEFLNRTGGVTMDDLKPGGTGKSEWIATVYADFSFRTGVAYVGKVRFEDGEIWSADLDAVALQMRKIEKDFDVKNLRKKDEPRPGP